jgi:hypothetical protein
MQTTATSTGLFDALTDDELKALMDALITRHGGRGQRFSSNRMAGLMGQTTGADAAYHTYRDIAREIGQLYSQVVDVYVARVGYTGA